MYSFRHHDETVLMKKISYVKCSVNKTDYISSDEDGSAIAKHSDDSEDNVIAIGYKLSSLKQLRNSWNFISDILDQLMK